MSLSADALRLSGLAGLVAGALYGNYQEALLSPMTMGGTQTVPGWMTGTHVHLMGLALIVIVYSFIIDDVFRGYKKLTAGATILGQWLVPLSITAVAGYGIGPAGMVSQAMALVLLMTFTAFLVNYARRGFGTA